MKKVPFIAVMLFVVLAMSLSSVANAVGFKVAWKETVRSPVNIGFIAGGNFGDFLIGGQGQDNWELRSCRWQNGSFRIGSAFYEEAIDLNNYDPFAGFCSLISLPSRGGTSTVLLSSIASYSDKINLTAWQYQSGQWQRKTTVRSKFRITSHIDGVKPKIAGLCIGERNRAYPFLANFNRNDVGKLEQPQVIKSFPRKLRIDDTCIAADLNGDGRLEWLIIPLVDEGPQRLEIWGNDGRLKFKSKIDYAHLAIWKPVGSKVPILAVSTNTGSSVHLYQWSNGNYRLIWKSPQIGAWIDTITVGDPKIEGRPGLVLGCSTGEGDRCTIAKIVPQ